MSKKNEGSGLEEREEREEKGLFKAPWYLSDGCLYSYIPRDFRIPLPYPGPPLVKTGPFMAARGYDCAKRTTAVLT